MGHQMFSVVSFLLAILVCLQLVLPAIADSTYLYPKSKSTTVGTTKGKLKRLSNLNGKYVKFLPNENRKHKSLLKFKVPDTLDKSSLSVVSITADYVASGKAWPLKIKKGSSWVKLGSLSGNKGENSHRAFVVNYSNGHVKNDEISLQLSVKKHSRTLKLERLQLSLTSPYQGWIPAVGDTWEWILEGTLDTSRDVAIYDIDLFDISKSQIKDLQNMGRKVVCYFSGGSWENWRPDKGDFPDSVKGKTLDGWQGEKWLDISQLDVLAPIMEARLDLAVAKGCDGVEPDNMDGYINDNGFSLTKYHQLTYNQWMADEAHKRQLAVALKNDLDQIKQLVHHFDFAINEQCFEYNECNTLLPFINNDKAVLGAEYELNVNQFCDEANQLQFSFWKKPNDYRLRPLVGTACWDYSL